MSPQSGHGHGTPIVGVPAPISSIPISGLEYLTVDDLRDEFGEDIEVVSDGSLQRLIDGLTDAVEDKLGHGFGRALRIWSRVDEQLRAYSDRISIGLDGFGYDDYPTLGDLIDVISDGTREIELLGHTSADQPSDHLKTLESVDIGTSYDKRVTLSLKSWQTTTYGKGETHIFLPLNIREVVEILENGVLVSSDYYYYTKSWVVKKRCSGCSGYWSPCNCATGNIVVDFKPSCWGSIPAVARSYLLDILRERLGTAPMEHESFIDYAYTRHGTGAAAAAEDTTVSLSSALRRYTRKLVI